MLEILQIFVDNIAPILLIAGIGFVVSRYQNVPPKPISTLIFYIFSPALVFYSLYHSEITGGEFALLFGATWAFQITMAVIAFAVLKAQNVNTFERASVMLSAFCLNAGNYGLSLVDFAFGEEVFSYAVVVYIANTIMNYMLGVFVASGGRSSTRQALFNVLKTPAVYAVIVAFALRGFEVVLPLPLERTAERLAVVAIPLMLTLLGIQLGQFVRFDKVRLVAIGTSLKLLGAPLVALVIATLLGMGVDARTAFIMQASMPSAVLTLVLANQFDLNRDLQLNLIMTATLLSPITLSLLIYVMR